MTRMKSLTVSLLYWREDSIIAYVFSEYYGYRIDDGVIFLFLGLYFPT